MKLYEVLKGYGKKIKDIGVDLSDKPDVSVEATITVKAGKIVDIKHDYRGTRYLKDIGRHE